MADKLKSRDHSSVDPHCLVFLVWCMVKLHLRHADIMYRRRLCVTPAAIKVATSAVGWTVILLKLRLGDLVSFSGTRHCQLCMGFPGQERACWGGMRRIKTDVSVRCAH